MGDPARTRVVANPLGYRNDPRVNTAFDPGFVVDLDSSGSDSLLQ